MGKIEWSRDSLFVQFSEPESGTERYIFTERNAKGDTLQTINNYISSDKKTKEIHLTDFFFRNVFYRNNNRLHFKSWYNDTIYSYNALNIIYPKFFIDLKHYKLPIDFISNGEVSAKEFSNFLWIGVKESLRYIFIRYSTYSPDIKKELEGFILVDKNTEFKCAILSPNNEIGFSNDIDGGINFIPEFVNDSLAFQFVDAFQLKKKFNSENEVKYPEKKEKLLEVIKRINEMDNPILIIANLK